MSEPSSSNPPPKTVFIIGAGASNEVGLPIGSELKATIARALDIQFEEFNRRVSGDGYIWEALELAANNDLKYLSLLHQASVRIYDAMPQAGSIDTFLDIHNLDKEIELCGKLAIVRTILQAESKSTLFMPFFSNKPMDFESLEDTWFNNFFRLVLGNCRPSDLEKRLSSVALVIFNYDRCIEHYLYHALQKHHFMHESDVASLLRKLEIYHPYGPVRSLPWLAQSNAIAFGDTPSPKKLLALPVRSRRLRKRLMTFQMTLNPSD